MLSEPLTYAELGYAVFPCVPGGKKPLTRNGLLDATTDGEQIESWWQQHPNANVAIATQGLLVIDLDVDGAGNPNTWLADQPDKLMDLARAPLSITPRGGKHYIFRQPPGGGFRNTAGKLAPCVDTRADGGYIVVPPSVLEGDRRYRWGNEGLDCPPSQLPLPPDWLLKMLFSVANGGGAASPRTDDATPSNAIPAGQRNAALASIAGTMRRVGMSEGEILAALHKANVDRCKPPLDAEEVEKIAWSVTRYEPDTIAVAVAENWAGQDRDEGLATLGPVDPGPFPVELLDVPGLIGEVMAYNLAGAYKRQPELALGSAIALLATLTGRKVTDRMGTRTNLYCLGVCRSGGGKERARQVNKEILFRAGLERMIGPEGIASHAGLVTAVELQPAQLMQLDEIGRMLKTLASPGQSPHLYHIATVLMKLFTSSSSIYRGDAYADAEKNKTIDQPHLCIYGTTVPDSLYESLTTENVTDGFLSRMLIFEAANHSPDKQRVDAMQAPERIIDAVRWWGDFVPGGNLAEQHPKPIVIQHTDEALQLFDGFEADCDRRQSDDTDPLNILWTRAGEKAMKLALLYACSVNASAPRIDLAASEWGTGLSDYLTRKMLWTASQWITNSLFESRRQRVLRVIRRFGFGGISQNDLCRKTRSLTSREREEVLKSLQEAGEVAMETIDTGGRPRLIWRDLSIVR